MNMEININTEKGFKLTNFPDGQPHITIDKFIYDYSSVEVKCSIRSINDLMTLLLCSNALNHKGCRKLILYIPYLMGARYDRVIQDGDSFDLQVIAEMINSCGFERVYIDDVHSNVATALIKNSKNVDNDLLINQYRKQDAILICPDTGASKNISRYMSKMPMLKDVVYCIKSRDTSGNITLNVLESEKCKNRNCVIIDDLCDGGGTFLAIARQISPRHLTLIVSHGIFSKGLDIFKGYIDEIIVSDSYAKHEHELVKQITL